MEKKEQHITKNLANCKPREFLKQTNRVRKSAEKWLTATDIMNIRKKLPVLPDDISDDDRQAAMMEQMKKNTSAILDAILDEHPDETLDLLALMCFVEPEDADDYPIGEYLNSLAELLGNASVLHFFTSLAQLGRSGILS